MLRTKAIAATLTCLVATLSAASFLSAGVHATPNSGTDEAVVVFAAPISIHGLVSALTRAATMSSTGPAIREIGYTYQGANNVFTGGYIPPTGLSGAALVADFERYQSELLDDLDRLTRDDPKLHADILARKKAFAQSGTMVVSARLAGLVSEIDSLVRRVATLEVSFRSDALRSTRSGVQGFVSTQDVGIAGASGTDYCPFSGRVRTYIDTYGWRVVYNTMTWNADSLACFPAGQGYEHDFVLNNYDSKRWAAGLQGTTRGTGWDSNMPYAYLDYATIDDSPNEPVYTVGTFEASQLVASTGYYTWLRAYPGNSNIDTAKLVGQRMNVYAHSVWFVFPEQSIFIVPAWNITVPGDYWWSY